MSQVTAYVATGTQSLKVDTPSAPGYDPTQLSENTLRYLQDVFANQAPAQKSLLDLYDSPEYLSATFVKDRFVSERYYSKECDHRIEYYSKHFENDLSSYWATNIALTLILALSIALFTYGMIKWSSEVGIPHSDAEPKLALVGTFGGSGILILTADVIYRIYNAGTAKNLSSEYENFKTTLNNKVRWKREYNAYLLGLNNKLLEIARDEVMHQMNIPTQRAMKDEIEKILQAIEKYSPAEPKGPCPKFDAESWARFRNKDYSQGFGISNFFAPES